MPALTDVAANNPASRQRCEVHQRLDCVVQVTSLKSDQIKSTTMPTAVVGAKRPPVISGGARNARMREMRSAQTRLL